MRDRLPPTGQSTHLASLGSQGDAGLTQVEVAKRLGKAHSFLSKCELGERRVDFVELQQLAKIYGKDISFFRD